MSKYDKARKLAVKGLEHALIAHEENDLLSIDDGLDEYDALIPRGEIAPNSLLLLTLEFWSCWSDSATHDYWHFYKPLEKNDFPRLGKVLMKNLEENTEVTNEEIISNFSVFPSKSIFSKLAGLFSGRKT